MGLWLGGFMDFGSGLKTIVVATDLDGRSEAGLEYARKLAGAYGAHIVLTYGLDPLDYAAVDTVPGRILKGMPDAAREVLDKMTADLARDGIDSHSEIRQGAVAQMLIDIALQYEAGLIVIGTEGRQGAGPVVVGAVAEQLVRMASCPVMAVAADWNAGPCRPIPVVRFCLRWRGMRRRRQRLKLPVRWLRRFIGPCWLCMRAEPLRHPHF